MANNSISLVNLDFDTHKTALKSYLKTQSIFQDYDFDGSNMSVLLDILSYNTFLNTFYLNMAVSEGFLDSAQLRSSIVSHAKELNYTPRSVRSAKALINISFGTTGIQDTFQIPKGTQFSGENANGGFVFTTAENFVLSSASSTFSVTNLPIYEGTYINETFVVDNTIEAQKFVISNKDIDTTSINVSIVDNDGQTITDYTQASSLYNVKNTSTVYFIQSTLDEYYEIVFGDGIFGKLPNNNSTILITYRVSSGSTGNGCTTFFVDRNLGEYNNGVALPTITTTAVSADGGDAESIESIRFKAPRHYQTQDRAITAADYETIILENFPSVKAVNIYGGETVSGSAQYGRVFLTPISQSGDNITEAVKNTIIAFISNKNSIGIQPVIIDPIIIYVVPTIIVNVNFNTTNKSIADIIALVKQAAATFNTTYLQKFNTTLRYSKFATALNNADPSIESVEIVNVIKKNISPDLNISQPVSVVFNNKIIPGTITSSQFVTSDGNTNIFTDYNPDNNTFVRSGSMNTFNVTNSNKVIYLQLITSTNTKSFTEVGTINYETGEINIRSLTYASFLDNSGIEFTTTTVEDDIDAIKNDLIEIDMQNIDVQVTSI